MYDVGTHAYTRRDDDMIPISVSSSERNPTFGQDSPDDSVTRAFINTTSISDEARDKRVNSLLLCFSFFFIVCVVVVAVRAGEQREKSAPSCNELAESTERRPYRDGVNRVINRVFRYLHRGVDTGVILEFRSAGVNTMTFVCASE